MPEQMSRLDFLEQRLAVETEARKVAEGDACLRAARETVEGKVGRASAADGEHAPDRDNADRATVSGHGS
jgi:hypothetical protein